MSDTSRSGHMPLANLTMYDWPETEPEMNHFWALVRDKLRLSGISAPDTLDREMPPSDLWTSPDMILGHTCGWPFVNGLENHTKLVGVLDYRLENCPPGYYNSVLISRFNSDLHTLDDIDHYAHTIAINGFDSQSGYRVLLPHLSKRLDSVNFVETGSHRESINAVASGKADLAAIDAKSFRLALRFEAGAGAVKILGRTPPTPGTPLITSNANAHHLTDIRKAVRSAIAELSTKEHNALSIYGMVDVTANHYDVLR